jgi:hypothetical protein
VISHQLAITLVEYTALINLDGSLTTNQEEIILDCKVSDNACATGQATYIWDTPTEQEKCLYFKSSTKGTAVTSEAADSTYMSMDGSMVRLLMKEEPIAACGRLGTGTNYPTCSWSNHKIIPASAAASTLKMPPSSLISTTRMISCITAAEVVS